MTEWQQSHADAVTVHDLVQHRPLGLTLLTSGFDDVGVSWSHSSDLDDPSPFLEPGQLLLTTGRQFATFATGAEAAADYAAYVSRLAGLGVAAIGFGTEVLRDGTPRELVEACEQAGIALVEVPYATPFIAVSKFIADRIAAEARRRLEWALAAQEAISKAVLGSGGLAAAVRSASSALDARVAVLDPDGGVLEGAVPTWVVARVTPATAGAAMMAVADAGRPRPSGDRGGCSGPSSCCAIPRSHRPSRRSSRCSRRSPSWRSSTLKTSVWGSARSGRSCSGCCARGGSRQCARRWRTIRRSCRQSRSG
jgi:hypothetical protein